jgi:hypothetical protein
VSDPSPADEHAILDLARRIHEAHSRGDRDTAAVLLDSLHTDYEQHAVAEAMARRDALDQLSAEATLLRVFGAAALYGER